MVIETQKHTRIRAHMYTRTWQIINKLLYKNELNHIHKLTRTSFQALITIIFKKSPFFFPTTDFNVVCYHFCSNNKLVTIMITNYEGDFDEKLERTKVIMQNDNTDKNKARKRRKYQKRNKGKGGKTAAGSPGEEEEREMEIRGAGRGRTEKDKREKCRCIANRQPRQEQQDKNKISVEG